MKKLLIVLLALMTCALLFACVKEAPDTDTTAPSEEGTPAPTETPTETPTEPDAEETTEAAEETTEEVTEPSPVVLYQLVPEKNSLMQSYVIKTANGKLIVIDGGIDGEGKVVTEGGQILIGGNDSYVAMCHSCWKNAIKNQ